MPSSPATISALLQGVHPFDTLPAAEFAQLLDRAELRDLPAGTVIYKHGTPLPGVHLILSGSVEVLEPSGQVVSLLGARNSFGERGVMRGGLALTGTRAAEATRALLIPAAEFHRLCEVVPAFRRYYDRTRPEAEARPTDLSTRRVSELMTRAPISCAPDLSVQEAAKLMREHHISCLGVVEQGAFVGILTLRDLANRILAEGADPATPVRAAMTAGPVSLGPDKLGTDVLHMMLERRIGHLPIVSDDGTLVGMVTQTDLTRFQAVSSGQLVHDIARAETVSEIAEVTARIPGLLMHLVGGHSAHEVVTRLITDVSDAATRRLLAMAEAELGPPPVPYVWLACGSQGRQEQTGVSDQDNCLFIDDAATDDDMTYFASLARIVSDGLHAAGYVYCPGDMMATNPRWCQRVSVWRRYFAGWIATPDPMAQMLASVMFDLRPIGGTDALFTDLQAETLSLAARNSIFVAHMISNALKHAPPLGLLRGFATIRSGEHRNHIDMKHNGVVPVVDLGRIYALQGQLSAVNTRARLQAAEAAGVISVSGGRDLIDAYDHIAEARLRNQAALVRLGRKPDNFLAPSDLSDFERAHLRDAFLVVRTMQSALGHGRSTG